MGDTYFYSNFVYTNKGRQFCVKGAQNLFQDVRYNFLKILAIENSVSNNSDLCSPIVLTFSNAAYPV